MSWIRPEPALWALPGQVETDRGPLVIDTDFRVWAEAERLAASGELEPSDLLHLLCHSFTGRSGLRDRSEVFLWFLTCGRENAAPSASPGMPVLDYREDRDRIIAGFQREYGIDLLSQPLHWWRFRALLEQLLAADDLRAVAEYRCTPLDRVSKEQRSFYAAKKQFYALHSVKAADAEERSRLLAEQLRRAAGKEAPHV